MFNPIKKPIFSRAFTTSRSPRASAFRPSADKRSVKLQPPSEDSKRRVVSRKKKTGDDHQKLSIKAVLPGSAWRLFGVGVTLAKDPGKDDYTVHAHLREAIASRLKCKPDALPIDAIKIIRKSFDARSGKGKLDKAFEYTVDILGSTLISAGVARLEARDGWMEPMDLASGSAPLDKQILAGVPKPDLQRSSDPIVVVGSGPAGLFAALSLAEAGLKVVLLERGQAVEQRGRDIGALFVRRRLNPDSNLCYGEGGAGTWSDGKLTTRIGRNSDPVRQVLQTLVDCGAPEAILMSGKPHLGTERLVKLLKNFRIKLISLGVDIHFGSTMSDLVFSGSKCTGVVLQSGDKISARAVVLAVGHSARPLYQVLQHHGVALTAKSFAMGFRVEHPQSLIDTIRYGVEDAAGVLRGKGRIPVAEYTLAAQVMEKISEPSRRVPHELHRHPQDVLDLASESSGIVKIEGLGPNRVPLAQAQSGSTNSNDSETGTHRGVYSFCMCPGGQIVPTSTNEKELCINGMSFSRRNSIWANSALVVTVQPGDWEHLSSEHGALAGMALQAHYERIAATMGGGNFVAPVQRVTDFLEGRSSRTSPLPSSSYRLGTKPSALHNLFSPPLTSAIQQALIQFDRRLPGFSTSSEGLLHGVETRTSSPVRIDRSDATCESISHSGLFPCGEGAGYAGGIVSAAVDGLRVGQSVLQCLLSS